MSVRQGVLGLIPASGANKKKQHSTVKTKIRKVSSKITSFQLFVLHFANLILFLTRKNAKFFFMSKFEKQLWLAALTVNGKKLSGNQVGLSAKSSFFIVFASFEFAEESLDRVTYLNEVAARKKKEQPKEKSGTTKQDLLKEYMALSLQLKQL